MDHLQSPQEMKLTVQVGFDVSRVSPRNSSKKNTTYLTIEHIAYQAL